MNRGRTYIGVNVYGEDENLVYVFDTIKECALFFEVSERTINRRLDNSGPF